MIALGTMIFTLWYKTLKREDVKHGIIAEELGLKYERLPQTKLPLNIEQRRRRRRFWSGLPKDIIHRVAEVLATEDLADYVRFRAVCKSWRSSTVGLVHLKLPILQLPWLLLPFDESSDERSFYCFWDRKVVTLSLPQIRGCRIMGSTDGWLVVMNSKKSTSLFNPLTRARIRIPQPFVNDHIEIPLDFGPDWNLRVFIRDSCDVKLRKLIICKKNGILMANMSDAIGFKKIGVEGWVKSYRKYYEDILNYNKKFYGVSDGAINMFELDIERKVLREEKIAEFPRQHNPQICCTSIQYNLVESLGELLLVRFREYSYAFLRDFKFEVFKLKFHHSYKADYISINNLSGQALFVGKNYALSLPTANFPGLIQANCIYFNFISDLGHHFSGVLNLEDNSKESFPWTSTFDDKYSGWQPPVWLAPNLSRSVQNSRIL